jgi:F0F1-type ATP synthase membrane subunit c/vacuolar-type H+-ATPase subunit K
MNYLYISYIVSISVSLVLLTLTSMYSFYNSAKQSFLSIKNQPFSQFFIQKNFILGIIFFETPTILAVVSSLFIIPLCSYEHKGIGVLIGMCCVLISLIASVTLYYSNIIIKKSINACAAHPSISDKIHNYFLIHISIIQTPLLITMITLLLSSKYALNICEKNIFIISNSLYALCFLLGMMIFVSLGAIQGISKIAASFNQLISYHPNLVNAIFPRTILSIGLVEAPVIFSLIIFILLYQGNYQTSASLTSIIGSLIFGIGAGISSNLSGTTSTYAIKNITNQEDISRYTPITFFSQMLIDTRVLYLFIVVMMIIFNCGVLNSN